MKPSATWLRWITALAVPVLQAGCESGSDALSIVINSNKESVFSLPLVLREAQAVDPAALTLSVDVNNRALVVPKTGENPDVWSAVVNVPANRASVVNVNWSQRYQTADNTVQLTLAQQQKVVVVESQSDEVFFQSGGYNTSNYDNDNDGYSNLAEIAEGRSPVSRVDGYLDESGIYTTGQVLPAATQCGTQMPVAIPVRVPAEQGAAATAGDLSAWWCASYSPAGVDEESGTTTPAGVVVFVQVTDDVAPLADSDLSRPYNDDSVEIFIDGNNSKGSNYDGWDDYQFIFRADGNNDSPMEKGRNLPANLTSQVTLNSSGYEVTVFLPIAEVNIQNGQPFGINVEVNDDDDGGARDAKLSWIGRTGLDLSWQQPLAFGTAQIP